MKQKIYIAALLAGMLALAGCGGGGSAEPVVNDPPLSQADCDAGTIFSEGACLTQEQIAAAAEEAAKEAAAAAEEAAEAAAAEIVTDASAKITAANTLAEVDAVITGLDQGAISSEDYITLQGEATTKKGRITAAAVTAAIAVINAQDDAADVDFQLRTAKENNPNIPADDTVAQGRLEMAANDRKDELKRRADQQRDDDSDAAVQAAIAAIKAATTLAEVDTAEQAAKDNDVISDIAKADTGDDSFQKAAADKRRALESPGQLNALMNAEQGYTSALSIAEGAEDTVEQGQIDAVETALGTLKTRITEATAVSDTNKADAVQHRDDADAKIQTLKSRLAQVADLKSAEATVISLTKWTEADSFGTFQPTRAEYDAIDTAIQELRRLLEDESDAVVDNDDYWTTALLAEGWAQGQLARIQGEETQQNNQENADALAMARKLHAGISMPTATDTGTADTRFAEYVTTAGTPAGASVGDIKITISDGAADTVALSEDKTATVAPLHGWTGQRFERSEDDEGTYEAIVYSHIEATMGDKFGSTAAVSDDGDFEYRIDNDGMLAVDTTANTAYVNLIGGSNFDHQAGVKRFPLPEPNPGGATIVTVRGTFHGVSGTYTCTPASAVCAANVSGDGFELGTVPTATNPAFTGGGGAWMFKPTDANDRVTDSGDSSYPSFGWWLYKSEDDSDYTASSFVDRFGAADAASGLNPLNGTATYMGGAVGKYALTSSTGGTNDAGHFTARAKLDADFNDNTSTTAITGTIDQFVGADGESRNWSVKLNGSAISDGGGIGTPTAGTEWTIGETAADDAGNWTGSLQENGDDGVPTIATGTFYSTYGTAGKMVGAFGANKQ